MHCYCMIQRVLGPQVSTTGIRGKNNSSLVLTLNIQIAFYLINHIFFRILGACKFAYQDPLFSQADNSMFLKMKSLDIFLRIF